MTSVAQLDALVGLHSVKRLARALWVMDSGLHAVLLYGSEGAGKSTVADILAQACLCQQPTPDGACGACQSCRAFVAGRCADFQRIVPGGPSFLIRLGAITPTNESSEADEAVVPVQEFLRTGPLSSRAKVIVLEDVDRLGGRAANALLKTLEEPPSYARLFLTTRHRSRVLPTILSRCVGVACELPTPEEAALVLNDIEPGLRQLAGPSIGVARRLASGGGAVADIAAFAERLPERPRREALVATEEFLGIADRLAKETNVNARHAQAVALQALGEFLLRTPAGRTIPASPIVEAHRRIVQNGAAGTVLDALFLEILASA